MRKRVRLSSSYSKKRELGGKRDTSSPIEVEEDRISQLPDEVLVSILSLLTIREAARTSVLSHRWVKLWTCFNGSLTFDLRRSPFGLRTELRYHEIDRSNYIDWVNQVLASLDDSSSSTTLVDFTVRFDSDKDSRSHIDRWIQFALEKKKLQKIELDMQPRGSHVTEAFMRYTFSLDFYTRIKQPRGLYTISTLSSLCLKYVDVTEELIEFFLSNCPLLERLCVVASEQLLNLKVTGVKLPLKYLEVYLCFNLESLEISAPNLLAFKYFGPRIKLHVENVPRLLDVSIGREDITYMVGSLSNYFSQLETLRLDIMLEKQRKFKTCLNLNKLKHLTLKVEAQFDVSILGWTSLIKAAPFLHTFTLELIMFCPRFRRQLPKVIESPHQCLKVVELVGFVGCSTDIGLAMYLLANASALEKIIIDRRFPLICGGRLDFDETKETKAAKRRALGLKRKLRKGVELVIV